MTVTLADRSEAIPAAMRGDCSHGNNQVINGRITWLGAKFYCVTLTSIPSARMRSA